MGEMTMLCSEGGGSLRMDRREEGDANNTPPPKACCLPPWPLGPKPGPSSQHRKPANVIVLVGKRSKSQEGPFGDLIIT